MALKRFLVTVFALLALTAVGMAQRPPVPGLEGSNGGDITGSYMLVVKNSTPDMGYQGADFTLSRYFSRHLGFRLEADGENMPKFALKEYGYRGGLAYRFSPGKKVQPYVQFLAGYARATANYLPTDKYESGLSVLGGGGFDYRLKNSWFVRAGADITNDHDASTKYGRLTVGISYHFADNGGGQD